MEMFEFFKVYAFRLFSIGDMSELTVIKNVGEKSRSKISDRVWEDECIKGKIHRVTVNVFIPMFILLPDDMIVLS